MRVLQHQFDLQVFQADDPITSVQGARGLVLEISPLVAHLLVLTGQSPARLLQSGQCHREGLLSQDLQTWDSSPLPYGKRTVFGNTQ
ncbi:MAG: hypothetical protein PVF74_00175 [Anaerolineales bacterium]